MTVSSENGTTQKCVCVYLPADAWSSHVWSVLCVIRNISYNGVVHVMAPTQMWTETQRYIIYLVGCSQESSAAGKQPARADTAGKGPVGLSFYVKCCQPQYQDALQSPGAFCRMQASMLFWPINICIAEYMSQRLSFWERTERSQLGRVPNYICCFDFFYLRFDTTDYERCLQAKRSKFKAQCWPKKQYIPIVCTVHITF